MRQYYRTKNVKMLSCHQRGVMDPKTEILICRVDKKTHLAFKSLCVNNQISMQQMIETFIKGLLQDKRNDRFTR
jgi:hypothetical protein